MPERVVQEHNQLDSLASASFANLYLCPLFFYALDRLVDNYRGILKVVLRRL